MMDSKIAKQDVLFSVPICLYLNEDSKSVPTKEPRYKFHQSNCSTAVIPLPTAKKEQWQMQFGIQQDPRFTPHLIKTMQLAQLHKIAVLEELIYMTTSDGNLN